MLSMLKRGKKKFNAKITPRNIIEGSFVLRYNNRFDYNKGDKFVSHWEGPFKVLEKFDNGSYQLMDASGTLHYTRVNGWRLKPYFSQILEKQVDSAQVSFDSNKPFGLSAQDPSLAQHVSLHFKHKYRANYTAMHRHFSL